MLRPPSLTNGSKFAFVSPPILIWNSNLLRSASFRTKKLTFLCFEDSESQEISPHTRLSLLIVIIRWLCLHPWRVSAASYNRQWTRYIQDCLDWTHLLQAPLSRRPIGTQPRQPDEDPPRDLGHKSQVTGATIQHEDLGRVVRKPDNVNPGLNVNWSISFSYLKTFFTSNVWSSLRLLHLKTEG